jgi:hypothetical protein
LLFSDLLERKFSKQIRIRRSNMKGIIAVGMVCLLAVFSISESGAVEGLSNEKELQGNPVEVKDGNVENLQGEVLGKVSHIVMDSISGRAVYVLIQDGERLYPVPADLLAIQADTGKMVIDIDKEKFTSSPSFTAETIPDLNDTEYGSRVHRFYGVSPFWEREETPGDVNPREPGERMLPPGHPPVPEIPEGHPPIN